jgi:hypothetical protein
MTKMPDSLPPTTALKRLKSLLQAMDWRQFETMAPKLVGRAIDTRMSVAGTGFQEGADAGTVGRSARRLRIEAKRYTSDFDARDIIGGLRQAIARDPALEAWIACSTRDIPEQLANALEREGANEGVPVLAIDWASDQESALAALCTVDADIVAEHAGEEAGHLAAALRDHLALARKQLAGELAEWKIGFEQIRGATHSEFDALWHSSRSALARFGQDVAGGDGRAVVRRASVLDALESWWRDDQSIDAPAAVLGQGGVGKTWATLSWVAELRHELPIILTVPAGAVTGAIGQTAGAMLALLGDRLAASTGVRDAGHWMRRVDRLLKRPLGEGPAICLILDGINQNPSVPWLGLLRILQDRPFAGLVRVIVTCRPQYFDGRLGRMRSLAIPPRVVPVERFDDSPGGELEQMLAKYHLSRSDLNDDLIELARAPRLFGLVVRLRDRLVEAGRVTTHRLLWEYGRDVFGERGGTSFSEEEWRAWLAEVARRERTGMRQFTLAELGQTAARPDLGPSEVAARLSDIVDGNFTRPASGGTIQLVPDIVAHALGAALLDRLDAGLDSEPTSVSAQLAEWLDPIAGLEERAEVLRAATSILAERDIPARAELAGAVVTAWLQTQNLPPSHIAELRRLAPNQVQAFLDAIEQSDEGPQASARALAVDALRAAPSDDPVAYGLIVATCVRWLSRLSRELSPRRDQNQQAEAARAQRLLDRIGTDTPGPITVLGVPLELCDRDNDRLANLAATVLDDRPLAGATEVFLRAALSMAIRRHDVVWDDLKWLCLLNPVDAEATTAALRLLSSDVAGRVPEPGVNPMLAARVASLLLWLTGVESDEVAAWSLDPGIDRMFDYEQDYLRNPGDSLFRLERRHAAQVLADRTLPFWRRCARATDFLLDPSFELPPEFVEDARAATAAIDPAALDVGRYHTQEDHRFEGLEIALARAAPDLLARIHQQKVAGYAQRPVSSVEASSSASYEAILLVNDETEAGCRPLRERAASDDVTSHRGSIATLLLAEVAILPATEQVTRVLDADPEYILVDMTDVLRPLSAAEVDNLLDSNEQAPTKRLDNLICVLSAAPVEGLNEPSWQRIERLALNPAFAHRACAFQLLRNVDAARFGRTLLARDWVWSSEADELCRHHGSWSVVEASGALPFEEIAPRIAPVLLAHAVVTRGGAPAEARLAGAILDAVVMRPEIEAPDPGSVLSVDSERRRAHPLLLTITPGPMEGDENNPFAALTQDEETRRAHSRRAVDTAIARVTEVREAGASLYLSSIEADDLVAIVTAVPDLVERWIEGADAGSRDFRRRVHLAEGLYLALCEALLRIDIGRGAPLWRTLRSVMHTRYTGRGGVSELVLMLFRLPEAPTVLALRDELLTLEAADLDERLLDLAVAAIAYGQEDWLTAAAARDRSSDKAWRRRRGIMLEGFATDATLPVPDTHLEGTGHSQNDERRAAAARRLSRDASARHWWRRFVEADDAAAAFAAWTLFRRSADRRALAWLGREPWPDGNASELARRKLMHVALNERGLVREAERREKDGALQLFDRRATRAVHPWYHGGQSTA